MAPIRVGNGDRSGSRRRRLRKRYSSLMPELSGSCSDSEKKGKIEVMEDDDYDDVISLCPNSSSDDDDDDDEEDGRHRKMTKAEKEIYFEQLRETGGFDVDVPPGVADCGLICPHPNFDKVPWFSEGVKRCSRKAIKVYNRKHKKSKYRFLRVVKVCSMMYDGFEHYITFEAKAKGAAAPMCFQAIVHAGLAKFGFNFTPIRCAEEETTGKTGLAGTHRPSAVNGKRSMARLISQNEEVNLRYPLIRTW